MTSVVLLGCAPDRGGGRGGQSGGNASGIQTTATATAGTDSATAGTDSATAGTDSATAGTVSGGGGSGEIRLDVGTFDGGGGPGDCMGGGGNGDVEFSYIWIANSAEGTVSKIDTKTGIEEGRYYTDPSMGGGSPSRTSVNLLGDVAVSNRWPASTTKVAARPERCVDLNNNGMIDTSTGPGDVRPWGQDECVLWNTPFPAAAGHAHGARPTQWEGGETDANGCADPNPRLWVAFEDAQGQAHVVRLDGETGTVLDEVTFPWGAAGVGSGLGPYGGVVNAEGDLYVSGLGGSGRLFHVDAETLQVTDLGNPGNSFYGIGIDQDGNPWIAGGNRASVWDAQLATWVTIDSPNASLRGIQVDREGRAWAAGNGPCGLVVFDVATRTVLNGQVDLPGCSVPVGVSIDPEGFVWSPDMTANLAFKVDPNTYSVSLTVPGLNQPYTYSDMTGAGLGLVTNPPAG